MVFWLFFTHWRVDDGSDIHRKQSEYPCEYNGLLTFTGILEIVEMAHFLRCPAENVRVNLGERGAAGELFNVFVLLFPI